MKRNWIISQEQSRVTEDNSEGTKSHYNNTNKSNKKSG